MVDGLIGTKLGMTQVFHEDGGVQQVTVIQVGPCVVVQRRTVEKDGYEAAQVGLVDPRAAKRATKAMRGHHEKAGVPPTRMLREFKLLGDDEVKPGDAVTLDILKDVQHVDILGVSQGKGFQGVIRRHGFGGGRATHGSMFHRAPGSIGQSANPAKVLRGMRMPGQMGNRNVTMKNCKIARIDDAKGLLLVQGSVPGPRGSRLLIRRSKVGKPAGKVGGADA